MRFNLFYMRVGNVVRYHDEAVVRRHVFDKIVKNLFIRRPAAACYDTFSVADKFFNIRETLSLMRYFIYAVESGVAGNS